MREEGRGLSVRLASMQAYYIRVTGRQASPRVGERSGSARCLLPSSLATFVVYRVGVDPKSHGGWIRPRLRSQNSKERRRRRRRRKVISGHSPTPLPARKIVRYPQNESDYHPPVAKDLRKRRTDHQAQTDIESRRERPRAARILPQWIRHDASPASLAA